MMPVHTNHVPYQFQTLKRLASSIGIEKQWLWVNPVTGALEIRDSIISSGRDETYEEEDEE